MTKSFNYFAGIFFLSLLVACAGTHSVWVKPGAKDSDFNQEKYACMQSAQQPYASSIGYNSGGIVSPSAITTASSSAGIATNEQLFNACMNAKGWTLRVTRNQAPTQAISLSENEANKRCEGRGLKAGTYPFNECVKSLVR
jgi:hypothetical protein